MKILWFTWKDKKHPQAGGAELVNEELAKRLVVDGHEVIFLVGGYKGCQNEEVINGYKVVRLGNRFSVYWKAFRYYRKNLKGWADLVIDEVNTMPFFCKFYTKQRNILIVYQLCRQIWFYQMFFPLNIIGYLLEPIYLRLLNDRKVITISLSSKKDLMRFGFKGKNVSVISVGTELEPVNNLEIINKFEGPTILSLGSVRSMKRARHIVKAFEIAKENIPNLEFIIAGDASGAYGKKVLDSIKNSKYSGSIRYLGRVDISKKIELMQRAHLIVVTSVKEGWGLIVTEANSQGTPAVVYNVDGLRDAVRDGRTGLICDRNTPMNLSKKIMQALKSREEYEKMRFNAWQWSREINFQRSYEQFISIISKN